MSGRSEARSERERRIAQARAVVAEVARLKRIRDTEVERDALAAAIGAGSATTADFEAMLYSERGAELRAFNSREFPPIALPLRKAAPRNSGLQEAILDTLADGEMATTGMVIERLGMSAMGSPTLSQRVNVTRALSRLSDKGLIDAYRLKERTLRGDGRL
ncbi:MAG TPA: hypothetical protein VFE60_08730 [Roseiarcus sp.]|jgi:DNA-binding transcriptional ArsR family regulator|nr:hypothetical protein [Roseiarcus sp.]